MTEHDRPFFKALVFEKDGDLNLTWFFVLLMGGIGLLGFVWVIVLGPVFGFMPSVLIQIAAWSFLAGAFASVLLAAIPIAKAKVLANASLPKDLAKTVESVADHFVEQATDVQEIKSKQSNKEIG